MKGEKGGQTPKEVDKRVRGRKVLLFFSEGGKNDLAWRRGEGGKALYSYS